MRVCAASSTVGTMLANARQRCGEERVHIAFKAFHEDVDSFGGIPYYDGGKGRIAQTSRATKPELGDLCGCSAAPWSGAMVLKCSSMQDVDAKGEVCIDIDAPPDICALLDDGVGRGRVPMGDALKGRRLFVCGLVTDFCVIDTCINARAAGFEEVYIVFDAARAVHIHGIGAHGTGFTTEPAEVRADAACEHSQRGSGQWRFPSSCGLRVRSASLSHGTVPSAQVIRRAVAAGVRFTSALNLLGSDLARVAPLQQSEFPGRLPSFGLLEARLSCNVESHTYSVEASGYHQLLLKASDLYDALSASVCLPHLAGVHRSLPLRQSPPRQSHLLTTIASGHNALTRLDLLVPRASASTAALARRKRSCQRDGQARRRPQSRSAGPTLSKESRGSTPSTSLASPPSHSHRRAPSSPSRHGGVQTSEVRCTRRCVVLTGYKPECAQSVYSIRTRFVRHYVFAPPPRSVAVSCYSMRTAMSSPCRPSVSAMTWSSTRLVPGVIPSRLLSKRAAGRAPSRCRNSFAAERANFVGLPREKSSRRGRSGGSPRRPAAFCTSGLAASRLFISL